MEARFANGHSDNKGLALASNKKLFGICENQLKPICNHIREEAVEPHLSNNNIRLQCESCRYSNVFRVNACVTVLKRQEKCIEDMNGRLQQLEANLSAISQHFLSAGYKMYQTRNEEPPPSLPRTLNRKAVWITTVFVLLSIVIGTVIATTTNIFEVALKPKNTTEVYDGTLKMFDFADWGGRPPKQTLNKLKLPAHRVIISHTASEGCTTVNVCKYRMRIIQSFHMDSNGWDDIGYNFLVGGDGFVYVGRGWNKLGAHTQGYNVDSIGISFIGTFTKMLPTNNQLQAAKLLIEQGVRLGKLVPNYKLFGHRQLSATESPGENLYKIIKTWPNWSNDID